MLPCSASPSQWRTSTTPWAIPHTQQSGRWWWRCRRSRKREEGAAPVPDGAPGKVLLVRHDSQPQCPPLRPAQLHQGAAQQGHHHQVPGQHDLKLKNVTLLETLRLNIFHNNIIYKTEEKKCMTISTFKKYISSIIVVHSSSNHHQS